MKLLLSTFVYYLLLYIVEDWIGLVGGAHSGAHIVFVKVMYTSNVLEKDKG